MTAYNENTKELTEAVNSILDQTYPDLELIIILDDPTNTELEKNIEALAEVDQRIKFKVNDQNMGLAQSLNRAIALSSGEYIARMDADDISFPNRFADELELIKERDYDVVTSSATFIDEEGKIVGSHDPILTTPSRIDKLLPFGSNLVHSSAFFKGSVLREFSYHNYPTAEDYDLWLRLIEHQKKIGGINSELLKYRIRSTSMTQSNKLKMFLTAQYLRDNFQNKSLDDFDLEKYHKYLSCHGYSDKLREEFSDAVNGFSKGLKDLRKFKFSGVKALTPLLQRKIYRDYFKNSYQYKKMYKKLIIIEHGLS